MLRVVLYRAFKYHRTDCSKCEKQCRGRSVDCRNEAHMTRNSSLYVKVNVSLYRPMEGCRMLRLPRPFDQRHMKEERWSALHIGCLYPLGELLRYLFLLVAESKLGL